jgi:signal transduction histidine kinase
MPLFLIAAGMVLYNSIFALMVWRGLPAGTRLERLIIVQMALDQAALTGLLYFSGMAYNPFVLYFVFHMIIAALLLHGRAPYGLAAFASLLVGVIVLLEYAGLIPAYNLNLAAVSPGPLPSMNELPGSYLAGFWVAFSTTLWITVYFTSSVHAYVHQAEAVMRQKEKMLGISQLAAGIAHQIANPLDGAQNCLRTIGRGINGDEHLEKYVALMTEALGRIEQTARRVQSFARPHALELGSVDVNKAVEAVAGLLGPDAAKDVRVVTALDHVPEGLGDFHTLQEVLFNLSTNALAAMPRGGTLTFRTVAQDAQRLAQLPRVVIEVSDTGCGIPPENLDRIFEPFFTTRAETGGTGLGLALCRMLISEMGGRIEVDSAVNRGTTFRIILNATDQTLCGNKELS